MTKEADTEDNTSSTSLSDESSSNKGSNHPIGAAIGGAIHKISSPIGTGIRKVVRHDSSSKHRRDDSSSPALNKGKSLDENKQNPIKDVADFFGEGSKTVKRLVHHKRKDSSSRSVPDNDQETDDLADVPPDDTLEKMNIIIDKRLKNVSISQYYETVWSEQSEGDGVPLFRSFLEESDKQDIDVGEWEVADNNAGFIGDWDGEEYQKRRTVTFIFDKKIPMQSKPVLAQVKQTHCCRIEGKNKCVVAMTIDMNGVPFSECFVVEVRWVATRSGKNDLNVQVGLFVNFIKSTILAGKIRSGTTEQTTQQQMVLFGKVQQACGATAEEVQDQDKAPQPSPPSTPKLSQEEAGRILILSSCLLLVASQAEFLFARTATQAQMSSSAVTSALAGLLLMVPNICQVSENESLLVVISHLVYGLCSSLISNQGFAALGSTVLLMAAWAVLAWNVLKQGNSSKSTRG
jgi:hypothetical protein